MSVAKYCLSEASEFDVNIIDSNGYTVLHFAEWCCKNNNN